MRNSISYLMCTLLLQSKDLAHVKTTFPVSCGCLKQLRRDATKSRNLSRKDKHKQHKHGPSKYAGNLQEIHNGREEHVPRTEFYISLTHPYC